MPHTKFLGKLIGLFTVIVAVSIAMRKEALLETVSAIVQSAPLLMVLGFISLAVGLAIVLSHNVWKGGLLPVLVTLAGWVFLLRGVAVLALPHQDLAELLGAVHYGQFFYVYIVLAFIVGAYMTVAGFRRT
jgi:hypothetical protein